MKAKQILCISLCSVLLVLSACSQKESLVQAYETPTTITFSWWGDDIRNQYTLEAIDRFEKLHPEIHVDCQYSEWSGYQTRNQVHMASHTEADVMQINYAWLSEYSPDGEGYYDLNRLTEYIDLTNFSGLTLAYGYQNEKLNAIPIALNAMTYYYQEDLFREKGLSLPSTWEELISDAAYFEEGTYPMSMVSKSAWLSALMYAEQQAGYSFLSNTGTLQFTADDLACMIHFYCTLVQQGVIPPVEKYDKSLIGTDHYAGYMGWISDASKYDTGSSGHPVVSNYLTADSHPLICYSKPATMYAIGKNTAHPKEAAILLDYLLNSQDMAELQGLEKGIPLSHAALQYLREQGRLSGIQYEAYLKLESAGSAQKSLNPVYENQDFIDAYKASCNEVLYDKTSEAEASEKLYETFLSLLE